jgi:hypothetical protein
MAIQKFTCPPQSASGAGTFSDNLVGFQLVAGGGLTQGNFEFVTSITEKQNRTFTTGIFSEHINLDSLGVGDVAQSKLIFENNYKVYPNFDLSQITNFTQYGSMVKRISTSIETIISKFPAALESTFMGENYVTGVTAFNIIYDSIQDITTFDLDVAKLRNPFSIDFTTNSTRNLSLLEVSVSPLRDFKLQYDKYSLYFSGNGYNLTSIVPTTSLTSGTLNISVKGNPFNYQTIIYDDLVIRPNDYQVNKVLNEDLDEVQRFLLNRNVTPIYTATFQVPQQTEEGGYYTLNQNVSWPIYGVWNLDILTPSFTNYLTVLNDISTSFDSYNTNLISRFLITGAFTEFDTDTQKMEKILQIYGRSFDETKKFIGALANMTSVNYNIGNDIPSQLLKNLAQTLGWTTNISPIADSGFLDSVFGDVNAGSSSFTGVGVQATPDELNFQYYRNLVLNSSYLFKSKGTRKSIETLLRLIGAPDALVEINEFIYLADQKINVNDFNTQYAQISGGTYSQLLPTLDEGNVFKIHGSGYTGSTTVRVFEDVNVVKSDYPIDSEGFPSSPVNSDSYFYQMGSGWFEQTPKHRAPAQVDLTNSVFTGSNPSFQTNLMPYTYGQEYLNRYRQFPYVQSNYVIKPVIDNNKSWVYNEVGLRENLDGNYDAKYYTTDDRLVINSKNIDLFLNPAQGLLYDVWSMSRKYNFPIPNQGLGYIEPNRCNPYPVQYPVRGGVDWTEIIPEPKRKTFFEFAQTFWLNTINVRNRQFSTDGGTGGYPTLSSIYWKYLESQKLANLDNNNFNYNTMIDYVNGLGDYWIRLVEQMIPASTLWNTGVRYENSIFHRQKFVWRRQEGCQLIPVPCRPCSLTTTIFDYDCPIQQSECSIYPNDSFSSILGSVLTNYLTNNNYSLNNCVLNTLQTQWFVDLSVNDVSVVQQYFYTGTGYSNTGLGSPSNDQWMTGLTEAMNVFQTYGYEYYTIPTQNPQTLVVYNNSCSNNRSGVNFKINVGINFNILCN